jgi:NADPH-dependent 2,4-dienoyl-CoA reductase/sulfur reductase-like enzyme
VPCDVCVGLGVVTTTGCVSASERESEGVATAGRICVVGGGIGGLAFALAGLHRGLDVTVYEKDDSFDTRSQVCVCVCVYGCVVAV